MKKYICVMLFCFFASVDGTNYTPRNMQDPLLEESDTSSENVYAYQDVPIRPVLVNGATLAAFLLVLSKKRYIASAVSALAAANLIYYTKFRKYLY